MVLKMARAVCIDFFLTLALVPLMTTAAFSASQNEASLFLDSEARLRVSDRLVKPASSKPMLTPRPALFQETEDQESGEEDRFQTRTLGLTYLRLSMTGEFYKSSSLTLDLRPDARLYRGEENQLREFDSRSGDVYRPATKLYFLNTYELKKQIGEQFHLSYGVFSDLAPYRTSYVPVLMFGLLTILPQKVSALKMSWSQLSLGADTTSQRRSEGLSYNLYGFQGREDRSEVYGGDKESFDKAPATADPHVGVALDVAWILSQTLEFSLLTGLVDTKEETGRVSETFVQLISAWDTLLFARKTLLTVDLRYASEKWDGTLDKPEPLDQWSSSMTAKWSAFPSISLFSGAHYGLSQRHLSSNREKTAEITGYQVDLGFQYQFDQSFEYSLFVSHESRQIDQESGKTGGFVNEEKDFKELRRVALEFRYYLSKGA